MLSHLLTKPGFQTEVNLIDHAKLAIKIFDVSIVDKVCKALKYPTAGWLMGIAGKIDVIKYFLSEGIEVNGPALRDACVAGYVDTARFIIENGANIFIEERGYTNDGNVLAYACINGHLPVVELLCSYQFGYSDLGHMLPEAIISCVENNRMDIVYFLLQHGMSLKCISTVVAVSNFRKLVQCAVEQGIPIEHCPDLDYDVRQLDELDCRNIADFPGRVLIANVLNSSCVDMLPFRSLLETGIDGLDLSSHYLKTKMQ